MLFFFFNVGIGSEQCSLCTGVMERGRYRESGLWATSWFRPSLSALTHSEDLAKEPHPPPLLTWMYDGDNISNALSVVGRIKWFACTRRTNHDAWNQVNVHIYCNVGSNNTADESMNSGVRLIWNQVLAPSFLPPTLGKLLNLTKHQIHHPKMGEILLIPWWRSNIIMNKK